MQGLLELAGVAYVGAGVSVGASGWTRTSPSGCRRAGIPMVAFALVTAAGIRPNPEAARAPAQALGFPLFVKPANAGSSVGVAGPRPRGAGRRRARR